MDMGPPRVMVTDKSNRKSSNICLLHGVKEQPIVPSNPVSLFTATPISDAEDTGQEHDVKEISEQRICWTANAVH